MRVLVALAERFNLPVSDDPRIRRMAKALADRLAERYRSSRGASPEDLRQTARVGLVAAVDRYDLDYGKDYKYSHDYYKDMQIEDPDRPPATQIQEYLPESLKGRRYYEPGHQGKEASIKDWLEKRRENGNPM